MTDVTQALAAIEQGVPGAAEQLLPLVYDELRRLASHKLVQERPGQTLSPTALVHEAYLRLAGDDPSAPRWNSRGHFVAAAAEAMRRILVEQARRKGREKHGGGRARVEIDDVQPGYCPRDEEVLALDEALSLLAAEDAQAAQLVQLRYFGGMSVEEAAEHLGIGRSTAYEHWAYARASLWLKMGGTAPP